MKKKLQVITILLLLIIAVLIVQYRADARKDHRELMEQLKIIENKIEP